MIREREVWCPEREREREIWCPKLEREIWCPKLVTLLHVVYQCISVVYI